MSNRVTVLVFALAGLAVLAAVRPALRPRRPVIVVPVVPSRPRLRRPDPIVVVPPLHILQPH